jgi:hypothetical protein
MRRPPGLIVMGIWNLLLGSVGLLVLFDVLTRHMEPGAPPLGGEDRANLWLGLFGLLHFASGILVWIRKPLAWRAANICQTLILLAEAVFLLICVYTIFFVPWGALIIILAVPALLLSIVSWLCFRYLQKVKEWFVSK